VSLTLLSAPNSAKVGVAISAKVKVNNAPAGTQVSTQFMVNGNWSTSQTASSDSTGVATIPLTYGQNTAGTYQWRLIVTGTSITTGPYTLTRTP
jgi:hypothetical protein